MRVLQFQIDTLSMISKGSQQGAKGKFWESSIGKIRDTARQKNQMSLLFRLGVLIFYELKKIKNQLSNNLVHDPV